MKSTLQIFGFCFCAFLIFSCVKEIDNLSDLRSDFYELQHRSMHLNDTLNVKFYMHQEEIDSVVLLLNDQSVQNNAVPDSTFARLGMNKLEINVYVAGNRINGKTSIPLLNPKEEIKVEHTIIKEYPHPKELFTEGFFSLNNKIYESAGHYKASKLVVYNLGDTDYLHEVKQDEKVFSEGIAELDGKIYQLTYRERKVFVYDAQSLELLETLQMPTELKEGWGMTSNGNELIAGDGSQHIYFFDKDLKFKRKIEVVGNVSIYTQINELEWINGKIFANVWLTPYILVINPDSGAVENYYDLSELMDKHKFNVDAVLNGIAYHNGKLLITGKNWDKIYEINLPE